MEEKLLTPDIARNVFNNGKEAPDFLRKRGTHIISTASVEAANAQRSAIANLLASKGSKCWSEALKTPTKNCWKENVSPAQKCPLSARIRQPKWSKKPNDR